MTNYRHGQSTSKIYRVWRAMLNRCSNPNVKFYADYGGRGITVCERWHDFEMFLADMGERPEGMTVDRIDNDKGYSPDNCRWASRSQQSINRRTTKLYEVDGVAKPLCEWAQITGTGLSTIWARINKGWDVRTAIMAPVSKDRRRPVVWTEPRQQAA